MLNKLERKFGRYAIPNLSLIMVGVYVLGFLIQGMTHSGLEFLGLDPYMILKGQVWRLFLWLLKPPYEFGIFTLINLYFIYLLGRMLERIWGNFRFNLYVISGIAFVVVGTFAIYGLAQVTNGFGLYTKYDLGPMELSAALGDYVTTYYIMLSVILAFSMTVPDMMVRLYFIIPLKMKWLAYFDIALIIIQFIFTNIVEKLVLIVSFLNFIIFYISGRKNSAARRRNPNPFESVVRKKTADRGDFTVLRGGGGTEPVHRCVICGITEKDAPKMQFRYCSKCRGSFEYCEDHLYTHTHVE